MFCLESKSSYLVLKNNFVYYSPIYKVGKQMGLCLWLFNRIPAQYEKIPYFVAPQTFI